MSLTVGLDVSRLGPVMTEDSVVTARTAGSTVESNDGSGPGPSVVLVIKAVTSVTSCFDVAVKSVDACVVIVGRYEGD